MQTWRSLTLAEREREYSPSSCVGDEIGALIEAYGERSSTARDIIATAGYDLVNIRYGAGAAQTIDLVTPPPASEPTPLIVYLHGGYWQQLSRSESLFAAAQCVEQGIAFAAVGYTLAPQASLDEIVDECRTAIQTLLQAADQHCFDPDRVVVCGSSAGGQLAAMMGLGLADGWRPAGLGLVSGIFELEPLIGTSINDAVQLDLAAALRNSPRFADLLDFPRTLIAIGSNETSEFKRQSADLAAQLVPSRVTSIEIADRNHFDVVLDLCDPDTELGQLVVQLATS